MIGVPIGWNKPSFICWFMLSSSKRLKGNPFFGSYEHLLLFGGVEPFWPQFILFIGSIIPKILGIK